MSRLPQSAYSPRLDDAAAMALQDFRHVRRKESSVPYISHLFAVTALVAEGGGDEDQLIAAMLHDWLEDVPDAESIVLYNRFGERVERIVLALSDTTETPKPPWRPRKEAFLARVAKEPADVKLVCVADKLHNALTLVRDLQQHGPSTLDRFRGGREGTVWYYRSVAEALAEGYSHFLLGELDQSARQLEALAK